MFKSILKLILVALIANATWRLFVAYSAHYKFKDSVQTTSQFGSKLSVEELRQRVLDLAAQYDVPAGDSFTLRRERTHTVIDGSYIRSIELVPGFPFPWPFSWHVDTFTTIGGSTLEDLDHPK